jgi:integral membrane protein
MKSTLPLTLFRCVAIGEGISAILLFFFAMPMKYIFDNPIYVKHIGMAHGVLYTGYVLLAFLLVKSQKWNLKTIAIIIFTSPLPFATFIVERRYLKK